MKRRQPPRRQPSELTLQLAEQMRDVRGTLKTHGRRLDRHDAKLTKHEQELRVARRDRREQRRMLITLLEGLTALRREVSLVKQVPEMLDRLGQELFRKLDARLPAVPGENIGANPPDVGQRMRAEAKRKGVL